MIDQKYVILLTFDCVRETSYASRIHYLVRINTLLIECQAEFFFLFFILEITGNSLYEFEEKIYQVERSGSARPSSEKLK